MPQKKITSAYPISEGTPDHELLAKDSKHVNGDVGEAYADLLLNSKYLDEGTTTLGD